MKEKRSTKGKKSAAKRSAGTTKKSKKAKTKAAVTEIHKDAPEQVQDEEILIPEVLAPVIDYSAELDQLDLPALAKELADSKADIDAREAELSQKKERARQIYERLQNIQRSYRISFLGGIENGDDKPTDGRATPSPQKNLKISAVRTLDWAKRAKLSLPDAINRTLTRATEKARTYNMKFLPDDIVAYIQEKAPLIYKGERVKV